jgi:catechol 2,3-dioxygenase-like lactoylglutathione lyase family enzyme
MVDRARCTVRNVPRRRIVIDHVSVGVNDLERSREFYRRALKPLGFAADRREQVDAFYEAAIAAGGHDNGPPGLRPEYSEDYYGAFVLDPDGHNIEAVHHGRA